MLEGKGFDYGALGEAMAYRRNMDASEAQTAQAVGWAHRERHTREAQDAGRIAQIVALVEALRGVDPGNPALSPTGRAWDCGAPQAVYQVPFDRAYDEVARRHGLARCRRALDPADAAEAKVLAEPISMRRVYLLFRRPHWRGVEYRTLQGAERAQAAAVRAARANVEDLSE